jgi:DNA-binding beta-propeller fold protein YncE
VAGADAFPYRGFAFTCGHWSDTGPATSAALAWPYGVAVDANGNVLIADTYNHCIRRVDANGNIATAVGTCGSRGFSGDGGPATQATLDRPSGVAVDASGNLFIADTLNGRIRKVSPDGVITSVAGNGGAIPDELPAEPILLAP